MKKERPTLEYTYEEKVQMLEEMNVMDDLFMREIFKSRLACEYLIRIVLSKPDLVITDNIVQADLSNPTGRSVILDVLAVDSEGNYYDIEIQKSNEPHLPQRFRYSSAMIDSKLTEKGVGFGDLPKKYIIFISEHDYFGHGHLLYEIRRYITGTMEPIEDGEFIYCLYTGGQIQSEDQKEIKRLANYLSNSDKEDDSHGPISDIVRAYKTSGKEQEKMVRLYDKAMQHYNDVFAEYEEALEDYEETREELERVKKQRKEEVKSLYDQKVPVEVISNAMNIPKEEIISLVQEDDSARYDID